MKNEVIERIEQTIENRGFTKKAMCQKIGIPVSTFYTWKTRNTTPDAESLVRISEFLGVSLDFLISGKTVDYDYEKNVSKYKSALADTSTFIRQATETDYVAFRFGWYRNLRGQGNSTPDIFVAVRHSKYLFPSCAGYLVWQNCDNEKPPEIGRSFVS